MTRIDFHTDLPDKIGYCCRLARKAYASGARLIVLASDSSEMMQLDQALWTFSERDFIPHVPLADPLAAATPVVLCDQSDAEFPHHDVLVNLSAATPVHFARFARLIELVGLADHDRAAGRERYRYYKQRGYALEHRNAGQQ